MTDQKRLQISLLAMRLTVFLVMAIWTVDKFVNPGHAAVVFEKFYFIPGLGANLVYVLGAAEIVLLAAFVSGSFRTLTYGLVLALHSVSTFSSFRQYLDPFTGANLLFFAAWPMWGACVALFLLRAQDQLLTLRRS